MSQNHVSVHPATDIDLPSVASPSRAMKEALLDIHPEDALDHPPMHREVSDSLTMDSYLINSITASNIAMALQPIDAFYPQPANARSIAKYLEHPTLDRTQQYWIQILHWSLVANTIRLVLLLVCSVLSAGLVYLAWWLDHHGQSLHTYALPILAVPLLVGLFWAQVVKFQWDVPISRMVRTMAADLDRPTGELLECDELKAASESVSAAFMLLLTNVSVLSNTLTPETLLVAIALCPWAVFVLLMHYYTKRIEPGARCALRILDYWQRLQHRYPNTNFAKVEEEVIASLKSLITAGWLHQPKLQPLAQRWYEWDRDCRRHPPSLAKRAMRGFVNIFVESDLYLVGQKRAVSKEALQGDPRWK